MKTAISLCLSLEFWSRSRDCTIDMSSVCVLTWDSTSQTKRLGGWHWHISSPFLSLSLFSLPCYVSLGKVFVLSLPTISFCLLLFLLSLWCNERIHGEETWRHEEESEEGKKILFAWLRSIFKKHLADASSSSSCLSFSSPYHDIVVMSLFFLMFPFSCLFFFAESRGRRAKLGLNM